MKDRKLTMREAARIMGIHYTELSILIRYDTIPYTKFGNQYEILESVANEWAERRNNKLSTN